MISAGTISDKTFIDAGPADLTATAAFLVKLHEVERGGPWEVGADYGRALCYLHHLVASERGLVYVARRRADPFLPVGCLVLEREDIVTEGGPVSVWSAGGLYCLPSAPKDAALLLMHEAAITLKMMGQTVVCLSAATDKNKRRATYRALGFRRIATGRGAADYYAAKLAHVIPAIEARLRRVI